MANQGVYELERVFQAPRKLVWQVWTDPKLFAQWYGPNVETILHEFDLVPGGKWKNEMRMGERSMYSLGVYREVVPEERLVWEHSSSNEHWEIVPNPMMPNWPATQLTTVVFEDQGEETLVRLTMIPLGASDEEIAAFEATMRGMDGGWGQGYAIIDDILARLVS